VESEEADEEATRKAFRQTAVKGKENAPVEKALTTRLRRKPMLSLDLLEYRGTKPKAGDIERNKEIIRKTYENFNINVEMGDVAVGPTVAQFTLRPAEGVKLSRIVALQNDLTGGVYGGGVLPGLRVRRRERAGTVARIDVAKDIDNRSALDLDARGLLEGDRTLDGHPVARLDRLQCKRGEGASQQR